MVYKTYSLVDVNCGQSRWKVKIYTHKN